MNRSKFCTVETEFGSVKGLYKSSALGRDYFSFNSIPYMKAPLGKLRFRDAQSPDKWNEVLDTTGARPTYTSTDFLTKNVGGQEDAGILSVDTPYVDRKLPVAIYIHGGGFQGGYGIVDMYGPDYLMQKDFLLVKINYRVGPIGFLSLEDPELGIPGNAGLKDQVFALKWIQRNIEKFGGDPNQVTVFGTSAGASSVHYLMMSDLAKGLFHRAIPMSGTSFIKTWAFADKKELTHRLAKGLGWDGTGGDKKILEILESSDAKKIVEVEASLLTDEEVFREHIMFPFTPVIEPYVTENTFMAEDPVLAGRKAWSNDIDCLIGATSLEGSLFGFSPSFSRFHEFIQNSDAFVTRELKLNPQKDQAKIKKLGEKLKKLYFGDELPSPDNRHQFLLFGSDILFMHAVYRAVLSRMKSNGKGKTFFYRFNLQTDLNFGRKFFNLTEDGAGHGDDLGYLMKPNFPMLPMPGLESKEFELIKKMISLVTSFIIKGKPNSPCHDFGFEPVVGDPFRCLDISNDSIKMFELPEKERMKVWDEILQEVNVPVC